MNIIQTVRSPKIQLLFMLIIYSLAYVSMVKNLQNSSTIIGLGLFFFTWFQKQHDNESEFSIRAVPFVLILSVLVILTQKQAIHYALFVASVVLIIEYTSGKISWLNLVQLVFSSAIFTYFTEVFTFPIRLKISFWVGKTLALFITKTEVIGNIIRLKGVDFSVDQACVGLDMLTYSLFFSVFLISFYQKSTTTLPKILAIVGLTFGLNIVNNFIRILALVILEFPPENPMHHIVGLISFCLYVCLPLNWAVQKIITSNDDAVKVCANTFQFEKPKNSSQFADLKLFTKTNRLNFIFILLCFGVIKTIPEKTIIEHQLDIQQRKTERALIYEKPLESFISVEHSPTICWRGSGYEFVQIQEKNLAGKKFYQAILKKESEQLHTAWWFSNNDLQTTSQFEWRFEALFSKKPFKLINVTANNETDLIEELKGL